MTLSEKTLLHLLEFRSLKDSYEYPIGVTQKGIASSIKAQRKHMPRVLKKLREKEMVSERKARIKGGAQRMKVYLLTWNGISKAKEIEKIVKKEKIRVRDKHGNVAEVKIAEINDFLEGNFTLLEILNNISNEGIFEGISEDVKEVVEDEEMLPKHEIYRHTLLQVWKDGKASVDEEEILEELRSILGITEKEHIKMQERIIRYAYPLRKKLLEIYSAAYEQALKDEQITDDERAILEVLREKLGIRDEEQGEIEGRGASHDT